MAVLVTAVLWLPDLYIFAKGQPPRAVLVLTVMHLAIVFVTYNALVHFASQAVSACQTAPPRQGIAARRVVILTALATVADPG